MGRLNVAKSYFFPLFNKTTHATRLKLKKAIIASKAGVEVEEGGEGVPDEVVEVVLLGRASTV